MRGASRWLAIVLIPSFLCCCTSLFFVHDPTLGLLSVGQLPSFLKSLRCELVTFYQIERTRKSLYEASKVADPEGAFKKYAYFDVAPNFYGLFTLELKVTDSVGLGSGTSFDLKKVVNTTTSNISHFGPTASSQGIYDLIWTFLMRQNQGLSDSDPLVLTDDLPSRRGCYTVSVQNIDPHKELEALELLAEDKYPDYSNFTRMTVNDGRPLAAWLRDSAALISANFLSPALATELAEPSQMYYQFALQVIGGLEGKYSLTSPTWSPLAVQGSASLQQNSYVSMWINGPNAGTANSAKSGGVKFGDPVVAPLGSKDNPIYIHKDGDNTKGNFGRKSILENDDRNATSPAPQNSRPKKPQPGPSYRPKPVRPGQETPQFLTPLPVTPPAATQ